ncbi:MAG: YlmH/Sll1252 family protein [Tissierellia bacterium]|nr:YlmH/Sll1252 family protein [Tissierellia bacterium]
MRQIIDRMEMAMGSYRVQYSDFLDPYELSLALSLSHHLPDLEVKFSGGYPGAERQIMAFAPDFFDFSAEEGLALVLIESKEEALSHREVLGSILGLGISRNRIGDIKIEGHKATLVLKRELKDFILLHLKKVGRHRVLVRDLEGVDFKPPEDTWLERGTTVSSPRLDALVSAFYNLPRKETKAAIERGLVKVDFREETRPSYLVEEGALISLRGGGRRAYLKKEGQTRKGRYHITYGVLKD